jgi:hypothetical protein
MAAFAGVIGPAAAVAATVATRVVALAGAAAGGSPASDGPGGGTFVAWLMALALLCAAFGLLRGLLEQARRLTSLSYAPHIPPA